MTLVLVLVLLPFAAGAGLLCLRSDLLRRGLVAGTILAVCCGTLMLAAMPTPINVAGANLNAAWVNTAMLVVEMAMALYVIYAGVRARAPLVIGLMLAQAAVMLWLD